MFPNLGSGQQAVKPALVKGLGLNPNTVPIVAFHCFTNQDIALDDVVRLRLRASKWSLFFQ